MARFTQGGGSSNNGGAALNYVQVEANQVTITTSPQEVTSLTITTTGAPVQVGITGEGSNASAGSWVKLALYRDSTLIGQTIQIEASAVSENVPYALNYIDDVAAGTYVYSAKIVDKSAGNWQLGEISGPVMNAVELTGFKGDRGLRGLTGDAGADALWNFTGAYELGASYAVGDVATYNGETWYRIHANGGNMGDTPSEGTFWTLIAQKGADGSGGGDADIADFTFTVNEGEGNESVMNIHNHDMRIETTRDDDQDSDISINSADDVWITANDTVEISSIGDDVVIYTNDFNTRWEFKNNGDFEFPDGSIQTTAYTGGAGGGLVVPTAIKDTNNDDFITFTKTNMGTARIGTPQDDLSLRSARDITLFAGDTGPGNVYIGWGDAVYTPDSPNRVATIGDISDNHGDFVFNNNSLSVEDTSAIIQAFDDNQLSRSKLTLNPNGIAKLEAFSSQDDTSFFASDPDWDTAIWNNGGEVYSQVVFTNAQNIINFFDNTFGNAYNRTVSINGTLVGTYDGASYGGGNITVSINGPFIPDTTVNEITFGYAQSSRFDINYDDGYMNISSEGMDLELNSTDDIDLNAADQIRFYSNTDGSSKSWSMDSEGKFNLPGSGYIENVIDGSGDGSNNDTLKLVPDSNLIQNNNETADQYIIIDPTDPDHIHIRAGGAIDESTATLILGGERNAVVVSDEQRAVGIVTRPTRIENTYGNSNEASNTEFMVASGADIQVGYTVTLFTGGDTFTVTAVTENYPYEGLTTVVADGLSFITGESYIFAYEQTWDNLWQFTSDGVLTGPSMGGVKVPAIANSGQGNDLYIYAGGDNISVSGEDININANDDVRLTTDSGGYSWDFSSDGKFYGSGEDGSLILGGELLTTDLNMSIRSTQQSVVLNGQLGEFLGSSDDADSQIATIGDVNAGRFGASASYHSRVTQGPQASANLVQPFTFSTTDWQTGIERVDNTKIKMLNAGKYNIAFSAQLVQGNNNGTVNIWLNKNGTPMAYTNTKLVIESNATYTVAAWNFFVDAAADDYYELIWSSSSTHTTIQYDPAQTINGNLHPEIPSIIVTVNQVG
jgi:hypothetical protein